MANMILDDILQNVSLQKVIGETEISIKSIQFDSRKVESDSVFVATRGTASDGHQFIPMAIEKGAKAIVCEEIPTEINAEISILNKHPTEPTTLSNNEYHHKICYRN